MTMQIALQTMRGYADTVELAQWAESEGLAALMAADHYLVGRDTAYALDQLTLMGAVAALTDTIELGTLVSPVTFRHPAVLLKAAVTLDEVSGGRFTLGVGAGWMDEEHTRFGFEFPSTRERMDRLGDALGYLRAALDGDEGGFSGLHFQLAPGPSPEPRGSNLRLVVGGSGARRTPALAGQFADEFNLSASETGIEERVARARRAASEAGRDPDALLISIAFPVVVGSDEAEVTARVEAVAARRRVEPSVIRSRWEELGIPVGTADVYRRRLGELESMGVQRVYLQVAFDPIDDIRRAVELIRG